MTGLSIDHLTSSERDALISRTISTDPDFALLRKLEEVNGPLNGEQKRLIYLFCALASIRRAELSAWAMEKALTDQRLAETALLNRSPFRSQAMQARGPEPNLETTIRRVDEVLQAAVISVLNMEQ